MTPRRWSGLLFQLNGRTTASTWAHVFLQKLCFVVKVYMTIFYCPEIQLHSFWRGVDCSPEPTTLQRMSCVYHRISVCLCERGVNSWMFKHSQGYITYFNAIQRYKLLSQIRLGLLRIIEWSVAHWNFGFLRLKVKFIFGSHSYAAVAVLQVPSLTQRASRRKCLKNCPALFKITIQWFWLAFNKRDPSYAAGSTRQKREPSVNPTEQQFTRRCQIL